MKMKARKVLHFKIQNSSIVLEPKKIVKSEENFHHPNPDKKIQTNGRENLEMELGGE
jgi:hypothetical protein